MKNFILAIIVTIFISGCSTFEVQVDYDPSHDFSSLSAFTVVYTKKNDEKDFTRARIGALLEEYMQSKGYKNVDKRNANFYIIMHLDIQAKSQVETNYETIGIRPIPCYRSGLNRELCNRSDVYNQNLLHPEPEVRVTTRTYEYEQGKLILEVFDVKKNAVVWQGIAKDEVSKGHSPEEKSAYIKKVIEELFKDFPSK